MMRIDAHHHLWPADVIDRQPWRPANDTVLRRAFGLPEFEAELVASAIDGSILMQSVDALDENDRLEAYAAGSDRIVGWVGYADLPNPERSLSDLDAVLALREQPGGEKLVGVRCLVGSDPMTWATTESGREVLRTAASESLVWDTVPITDAQADAVAGVAEAVPGLRIVVDHLASPPLTSGFPQWRARLERLAAQPNVAIKLSVGVAVLQRWDAWDTEALRPYVDAALELFGPARAMAASNWPVVLLRASHAQAWRDVTRSVSGLGDAARGQIEGGTALEWYGIGG